MIENLVPVSDRGTPKLVFKTWMTKLPKELCNLMRLLSDQIDSKELHVLICDTLAVEYKFESKMTSATGFWCDAAMTAMIKWLLTDVDMDSAEQLKYLYEAFMNINKEDYFCECLVLMGYSLPNTTLTPSSGHSVHFVTPDMTSSSITLPLTPPSPLPGTSHKGSDGSSPFSCTLDLKLGKIWENDDKEEDPSEKRTKLKRSAGLDDCAIIEYEEIKGGWW